MPHPDPTYEWLADLERKASAPIATGSVIGGGNYGYSSATMFGLGFGPPSVADVPLYLNVVVSACIAWLSRNLPVADLHVIGVTTVGDGPEIPNHPFIELMDKPNPLDTFHSFWQKFLLSDVVDGNTFFVKVRDGARGIHSLWWVPPWDVDIVPSPTRDADRPIDHYVVRVGGQSKLYPPEDVVHIKDGCDPINPYRGMAALKSASRSASTIDRAELFSQTLMKNCGAIPIVISPSGNELIPADNVKQLKESYAERQTGFSNGTPLFPTYGLKVDKLGLTPEEMAIDKIYEWPVGFACSTIGMSPMVVCLPDGGKTYDNYAAADRGAWQNGLIPRQARAAEAFDRQCPELIHPTKQRLKWDYSHVKALQDDEGKKVEYLTKAVGGPWMTPNEARDQLHLDPIDGGDELVKPPAPPAQLTVGPDGKPLPGQSPKPGLPPPKKPAALPAPPPKKSLALNGDHGLEREDDPACFQGVSIGQRNPY